MNNRELATRVENEATISRLPTIERRFINMAITEMHQRPGSVRMTGNGPSLIDLYDNAKRIQERSG